MSEEALDRWASWLLDRRFGGDPVVAGRMLRYLYGVRDKVLANGCLRHGDVVLDVGSGDGLIGFGALPAIGKSGKVILSDISSDILEFASEAAEHLGVSDQVRTVQAAADDLGPIGDESVDLVTTRSVLIYVKEKQSSFREFFRVLKPGGRLSLAEPINRDMNVRIAQPGVLELGEGPVRPEPDPDADPMTDFTERDLLRYCRAAGFLEIHIELRIDQQAREPWPWDAYLDSAPNPNAPTIREHLNSTMDATQFIQYEKRMKPLIEEGRLVECQAMAFLWAIKPKAGVALG